MQNISHSDYHLKQLVINQRGGYSLYSIFYDAWLFSSILAHRRLWFGSRFVRHWRVSSRRNRSSSISTQSRDTSRFQ